MTTLRKVLPFTLLCAALFQVLPLAAQTQDCSFTYPFVGDGTQAGQSNLSGNTPCRVWAITFSTDAATGGTLSSTVSFQTSPDNSTWTAVPNTVCSSTVQPPCVLQGANPIVGTQGMLYTSVYGAYVRIVVTGSSGSGHGTVRAYGVKGASAAALPPGGSGGASDLIYVSVNPVGACTVGTDVNEQSTVSGAQFACVGPAGMNNGTWVLVIAANSAPLTYYYTNTASDIATYLQATVPTFSPKTTITFTTIATGTHTIKNWATIAGQPDLAQFAAGAYIQHIHALRVSGGTVTLHTEFWEVSSLGVDIAKIGTTEDTPTLTTAELEYNIIFADSNTYSLASVNSRIVGRLVAVITGSASTFRVFVGGTADTHMTLPGNVAGNSPVLDPGSIDCPDATGSTTTYTCPTPSPIPTGYATGELIAFKPQTTNTTTGPTLDVATLGPLNLVAASGGAASLAIGQLIGGSTYLFEYDGTVLRLTSPPPGGTVTHTGALTANAVILGNGTADVKPGDTLPADATKFYNGAGHFTAPPAASAVPAASNLTPVTVSANTTGDQTLQEVALTAGALNTVLAANLIHGSGRFTTAALQTPTLTFKALLCTVSGCGSGTVVTLATITSDATLASSTNQGWNLQLMAGTSASGATGNLWVHGAPGLTVDIGALPGNAATPYTDTNTAVSSNIDLTAALFVDFTVATSTGSTGNSITQDMAEVLPQGAGGGGGASVTVAVPIITVSGTPYGPVWSLPPPPTTGWSTDNLGSGSFDVTAGYPYVVFPSAGADQLRMLYRNVPATPYTVCQTMMHDFSGIPPSPSVLGSAGYGPAWRDGTGKIIRFGFGASLGSNFQIVNQKWSASSSASISNYTNSVPGSLSLDAVARNPATICLRDDGTTNLTWYWTIDAGLHLRQFSQEPRTDFFTSGPTQIGIAAYVATSDVVMALIGYKVCTEPATTTCQ